MFGSDFDKAFKLLFGLAIFGAIAAIGFGGFFIWWLFTHVTINIG